MIHDGIEKGSIALQTTGLVGGDPRRCPGGDLKVLEETAANVAYSFDIIDTFASREQYGSHPDGIWLRARNLST